MRKDVKAGLLLALGVVVVAGWYYSGKKEADPTIPLANKGDKKNAVEKIGSDKKGSSTQSGVASRDKKNSSKRSSSKRPPNRTASFKQSGSKTNRSRAANSKKPNTKSTKPDQVASNQNKTKDSKNSKKSRQGLGSFANELSSIAKPESQVGPPAQPLLEPADKDALAKLGKDKETGPSSASDKGRAGAPNKSKDNKLADASKTGNRKSATKPKKNRSQALPDDGTERYIVQPGDSFMLLAEVYYGSQSHAGFLMRANPHVKDPKRLRVGTEIRIPELPGDSASRVRTSAGLKVDATTSGRTYVVKSGDSLTSIAEKQLGATARWKELYELNKSVIKNPDVLRSGVILVLPKT